MNKVIIMYGLPAAGKSTQAKLLREKYGFFHFAMGDKLREMISSGSEIGQKAKAIVESGLLVPDDVIIAALGDVASQANTTGVIFDGFPRKQRQIEILNELLAGVDAQVDACFLLEVSGEEVQRRIDARIALEARGDDKDASVVQNRLDVFKQESEPLCDYYEKEEKLHRINGEQSIEKVFSDICQIIEKL